jgi:hypothetical protein
MNTDANAFARLNAELAHAATHCYRCDKTLDPPPPRARSAVRVPDPPRMPWCPECAQAMRTETIERWRRASENQ